MNADASQIKLAAHYTQNVFGNLLLFRANIKISGRSIGVRNLGS
jgi:hypothetical protein